jgi:pimeloyl-ACP methyl ester carboxylesterase
VQSTRGPVALRVGAANIELIRMGAGRPLLFLHPHIGIHGAEAFLDRLSQSFDVLAPSHPGFGHSELPRGTSTVDDLAYFYLDLVEQLDLRDLTVVGSSFGGWIALELATKTTERVSRLVLLDAVGAKFGPRDKGDVVDIFSVPQARVDELAFHDKAFAHRDYAALSDDDLGIIARDRESTARFAWNPYMYNPRLRSRLHRVKVPTLVLWGASDGIAPASYGRQLCEEIPGARFEEIAQAGHFPHIEQPQVVAARVSAFALQSAATA